MNVDQQVINSVEAFDKADYRHCAEQARWLFSARKDSALGQMLLISLQRLGEAEEAGRVGSELLAAATGDPWQQALIRLSLGQVGLQAVIAEARTADQKCQAFYYAGARSFTLDRVDEAQNHFDRCLLIRSDCLEHTLAYYQITTLAPRTAEVSFYLSQLSQGMMQQARTLLRQGQAEEGLQLCYMCIQFSRKYYEQRQPMFVVHNLLAMGDICVAFGLLLEALSFYMAAVEVSLREVGEGHPGFAKCEENLAAAWVELKEYDRAEPMLRLALDIYRNDLGEVSNSYLACLSNLARLHALKNDCNTADGLLCQALEIEERVADTADGTRVALAEACLESKRIDRAVTLYERALAGYCGREDVHSEAYARALVGLGRSRMAQGNKDEAESLLRIALALYNHNLGSKSPAAKATRAQLAALLDEACDEESFPESMAAAFNIPGEFLAHLYHFAKFLRAAGHRGRAEAMLEELIRHCRSDRAHARTLVQSLLEQAHWYEQAGTEGAQKGEPGETAYSRADVLVTEALQAHAAVGGAEGLEGRRGGTAPPPDRYMENALVLRGLLAGARGRQEEAYQFHARATELRRRWLINPSRFQGRVTDNIAACVATGRFPEALEALRQWALDDEQGLPDPLGANSETQLLEYMIEFYSLMEIGLSYALYEGSGPAGRELVMDMLLRRKGIVADVMRLRASAFGDPAAPGDDRATGEGWDGDDYQSCFGNVSTREVADALPVDTALVEFVRYRRVNFRAITARGEARWTEPRYFALILPAAHPERVGVFDLGAAASLEEAIVEWLRRMRSQGREFQAATEPADSLLAEALNPEKSLGLLSAAYSGALLRERLLDPITNAVGTRTKLILAPEGALHWVPFQALIGRSGRFVADEQRITYVTTGRDLLQPRVASGSTSFPPVVIADPDYDWRPDGAPPAGPSAPNDKALGDSGQLPGHFTRLSGARREGEEIARLLGVKPWLDADARKSRVKALRSPVILHIATHGFFLPEKDHKNLDPGALLRRSGLALAGANARAPGDTPTAEDWGGVLTATDVMSLRLVGTELVVLLACETGLGEIRVGEGVFGLRRAFLVAGARTLVVSLWRVPDRETCELMRAFYQWLQEGAGVAAALDAAQETIRARRPHPYFWGAFVCIGTAAPLTVYRKA